MNQVQNIMISLIDPESEVNVRRQGVEQNVEQVKASIQRHGYWQDQPIIVRPHPNTASGYDYQHVTGQCRFKACLELGLEEIPAFILELDDDEAIQRSWLENEVRGDLTYSDQAYWTERIFKRYNGDGYTADEAIELAAKFLGRTRATVMRYYSLAALPDDLKELVDRGVLDLKYASPIVQNTYQGGSRLAQSQKAMRERTSWLLGLDRENRTHAVAALERLGHEASIAELTAYVTEKGRESNRVVEYAIPGELHEDLLEWGKQRGLKDEPTIIGHMVMDALKRRGR